MQTVLVGQCLHDCDMAVDGALEVGGEMAAGKCCLHPRCQTFYSWKVIDNQLRNFDFGFIGVLPALVECSLNGLSDERGFETGPQLCISTL